MTRNEAFAESSGLNHHQQSTFLSYLAGIEDFVHFPTALLLLFVIGPKYIKQFNKLSKS